MKLKTKAVKAKKIKKEMKFKRQEANLDNPYDISNLFRLNVDSIDKMVGLVKGEYGSLKIPGEPAKITAQYNAGTPLKMDYDSADRYANADRSERLEKYDFAKVSQEVEIKPKFISKCVP